MELPPNSALAQFCTQAVHAGHAVYFGVSVNASLGHAQFFCAADGRIEEESVRFRSAASFGTTSWPAAATHSNATVGFKNEPFCARSIITGLIADLGSFDLIGGWMLTSRMHAALANVHAKSLGLPVIENASGWIPNAAEFALMLDTQAALSRQFPLPLSTSSEKPSVDGQLLRLCQNSSASVELPPVTCGPAGPGLQASVTFRLQPAAAAVGGEAFTILTIGARMLNTRGVSFKVVFNDFIQIFYNTRILRKACILLLERVIFYSRTPRIQHPRIGGGEAHARLIGEAVDDGTDNRTFALRLVCSASTSSAIVAGPSGITRTLGYLSRALPDSSGTFCLLKTKHPRRLTLPRPRAAPTAKQLRLVRLHVLLLQRRWHWTSGSRSTSRAWRAAFQQTALRQCSADAEARGRFGRFWARASLIGGTRTTAAVCSTTSPHFKRTLRKKTS